MKSFIYALSALAVVGVAPVAAQAADLDGYDDSYRIERGPPEGPPVVRRDYGYYDGPPAAYYVPRYYRPYPYYAGYAPYSYYGYWGGGYRRHYWGGRPWGHGGHWGHRGWR